MKLIKTKENKFVASKVSFPVLMWFTTALMDYNSPTSNFLYKKFQDGFPFPSYCLRKSSTILCELNVDNRQNERPRT